VSRVLRSPSHRRHNRNCWRQCRVGRRLGRSLLLHPGGETRQLLDKGSSSQAGMAYGANNRCDEALRVGVGKKE
jgi:hypothetical protein